MRSVEDKSIPQEISGGTSCMSFEFHKSSGGTINRTPSHHRTALGKPTPSKWDDAQKWLVNLSRGEKNPAKASPRNSNADDRRLIAPAVTKKECSSSGEEEGGGSHLNSNGVDQFDVETKNVDCDESIWRISKPADRSRTAVRSICVRDMGTEMTPIASQEPSRTATPIRATTPASRSPMSSGPSTPVWCPNGVTANGQNMEKRGEIGRGNGGVSRQYIRDGEEFRGESRDENKIGDDQSSKMNPLETRALAWDEAERAKYMAR